jgi:predicted phosphodiesterase
MDADADLKPAQRITLAVVSDLHFCNQRPPGSGSELSRIVLQTLHEKNGKNPWSDLMELVKRNDVRADYLLCPGDITTHAAHAPLKAAWDGLVDLGRELDARMVACATGNHDVSSRFSEGKSNPVYDLDNPHDLFENLKLLSPDYPLHVYAEGGSRVNARNRRVHYFGADFVIHEDDVCRLVVFNSCARHITENSSYERGSIAKSALAELSEQLKTKSEEKINIFLCHHHPVQHSHSGDGSYDFILRGDELINFLGEQGDWIIIHGHKHDGRIIYAPHGAPGAAPVVFAASSMGAILSTDQLNQYRNQFYLLDIELPETGCSRGTLRVWNWNAGVGWSTATDPRAGLTDGVGFGEREHADVLAQKIATRMQGQSMPWATLLTEFSFLRNLTPDSLKHLLKSLKKRHGLIELRDESSYQITEIGPEAPNE